MSEMSPIRGGTAVAHLSDLGPLETAIITCLRHWPFSDALGLPQALGARPSASLSNSLAELFAYCSTHSRRPLVRHSVGCTCVGADEACLAHFVATASTGAREDALLMAMLLVHADVAPIVTAQAQQVGLGLKRLRLQTDTSRGYLH